VNPLADIRNICFLDFETRALPGVSISDGSVKSAGTYRYAQSSYAIILTYSIAGGPTRCIETWGEYLDWRHTPPSDLSAFFARVEEGKAWFAAFNAGFDRAVWNHGTDFFPMTLRPEHVIDMMAQVQASNLAPSLAGCARQLGLAGKLDEGKALIKLFCLPGAEGTPQTHPEEWARFKAYAIRDTQLLAGIFTRTRALPFEEWEEYWASERINERGVRIDLPFVERAARVAEADARRINAQLTRWSNGTITAVTQAARLAAWVYNRLDNSEAREILVSELADEADDEAEDKLSMEKARLERLLAFFAARPQPLSEHDQLTVDVLTLRLYGGSSSPFKFKKMLDQHAGGFLKGQYVFQGAAQTGRFSSKGVQIHNLTRSTLDKNEDAAIEMINELEEI
jgi:DNA polymerase